MNKKSVETKVKTKKKNVSEEKSVKSTKVSDTCNLKEKAKQPAHKIYIDYMSRVIICVFSFIVAILLSFFFLMKALNVSEEKVVTYQENGTIDYKVFLKPNEFYETTYLSKNMVYIASLIENINIDVNYQFMIAEKVNTNFDYQIVAKLGVYGNQGSETLYSKEYILKEKKDVVAVDQTIQSIKENIVIDYDYYNELANKFKSTFGVDATSDLTIFMRINKSANNVEKEININESSEMSLVIPLSQKTLNIKINDTGINNNKSIVKESEVSLGNIFFAILSVVLFIASVALILKTLEMLFLLIPKKSRYDKYIGKILNEYDRLIVETPTEPRFDNKDIIKIKRFEELLDARDNLKRPIMYYDLVSHQKCYFYIENQNTMYLLTVKAVDLEDNNEDKNKKKILK